MRTEPRQRVVLVTGCSTGIGRCAIQRLQTRGYLAVAAVRKPADVASLKGEGIEHVIQLDLDSSDSIDKGLHEVLALSDGRLDALFNNGAYGQPGAVEDLSREALRKQFETNVFGTHELTIKALPYLLQSEKPRIVQNSSILGFVAMPMRGAYNASKHALEGLSDTLRIELHDTSVRVSIIEPGPILTHFRQNALRALETNVDFERSRYREAYLGALKRLKTPGPASRFTLSPDAVVDKLIHALESDRPKLRYYVTVPTYLFGILGRFLPARWIDRILVKIAQSEAG